MQCGLCDSTIDRSGGSFREVFDPFISSLVDEKVGSYLKETVRKNEQLLCHFILPSLFIFLSNLKRLLKKQGKYDIL